LPRGKRHYRITFDDAVRANGLAIEFGGRPGIRREEEIRAAIARPYSGYHGAITRKAAALFQSIATGHGFIDGNKRCAMILTNSLIEESGYHLQPATDQENIVKAFEEAALWVVPTIRLSTTLWIGSARGLCARHEKGPAGGRADDRRGGRNPARV
jgi:death-on-curing protein